MVVIQIKIRSNQEVVSTVAWKKFVTENIKKFDSRFLHIGRYLKTYCSSISSSVKRHAIQTAKRQESFLSVIIFLRINHILMNLKLLVV